MTMVASDKFLASSCKLQVAGLELRCGADLVGVQFKRQMCGRSRSLSLTPWLQPGVAALVDALALSTAYFRKSKLLKQFAGISARFHRAKATVSMRADVSSRVPSCRFRST